MYTPISIKEAVCKVNNGWYLPAIQRPYVWGNRYESEKYICKLFDSMYQGYPIGVLILWNATNKKVAYREFLRHFRSEDIYENVHESLWGGEAPKSLVYDGQQRLQTMSSCLKHTFNNRILVFDLQYKKQENTTDLDPDNETGFHFIDKKETPNPFEISLPYLFSYSQIEEGKKEETKISLENKYIHFCKTDEEKLRVRVNIGKLWNVFVEDKNKELLAYYEISGSTSEKQVNEIFERLNTGGIQLSKTDLLYSQIKGKYPDFEADVMAYTKRPQNVLLNHYDLLQLLHLIVTGKTRIGDNVSPKQMDEIYKTWNNIQRPLDEFFDEYLLKHLHITDISIVRSKLPLFIIILFLHKHNCNGKNYSKLSETQLKLIDKFLITAELNDWTLQSYTDSFAKIVLNNKTPEQFPWNEIKKYVQENKKRNVEISEEIFCSYRWFSLKILTPNRTYYSLSEKSSHRYNPELDHIFPKKLSSIPEEDRNKYVEKIDVIWNMQPVTGDINNQKRYQDPIKYFKSEEGSKNYGAYDFIPGSIGDILWKSPYKFIEKRREMMISFLKDNYDIELIEKPKESEHVRKRQEDVLE